MLRKKTSKKKLTNKKKTVRPITAATLGQIADLAELLYGFLPLKTYSHKAETLYSIFKASDIQGYIPQKVYKKQAMETALLKLFRYHQRLPYTIFRKIIPASVKYRRFKYNPLKREEIDKLSSILQQLGIDLTQEFNDIELDQLAQIIVVPPIELAKRLESHPLCEQISTEPLQLFKNGHFNEAVRKATERFEVEIQVRTGSKDIGKNLMSKTFKLQEPDIALNNMSTENEKGIQEGFQFLTMGMIRGMRNIFSHGDENQRSPEEAYEMLLFINWLFRQLP